MASLFSVRGPGEAGDALEIAYDTHNHTDDRQTDSYAEDQHLSGYSLIDTSTIRTENQMLKTTMRQMQQECQSEQDLVNELRKRLMTSEREKLESSSKANGEISSLQSQVAKLRAQMEKGHAESQSLQYELAKARQETSVEKRNAAERDKRMTQLNENTKQKLSELTYQMEQLYEEINAVKKTNEDDQAKFAAALEEKEGTISNMVTEKDVLEAENERLLGVIQGQERTITSIEEKIKELEDEKRRQLDDHKQTLRELTYKTEKEEQMKKDLEEASMRIKNFEESIEAERAAHLESKFNSEIVQLRVHELEGALEVEKSAKRDATAAIEKLNRQLSALEAAYDEESKNSKETKEQLNKFESEYSTVKDQLTREVENKKNIIQNLSAQLEPHQKNFDELKEELARAKKRQIYLEETYGGNMRELELLIKNFQVDSNVYEGKNKPKKTPSPGTAGVLLPSEVLENLRHMLSNYKNRLDNTGSELNKLKSTSTTLNKELASLKKVLTSKERVLEDTHQNLTKANKELNKLRMENTQLQTNLKKVTADLQASTQSGEKERIRANGLSDELMKVARKHKDDNEEHKKSLHGIYQHLLAGHIVGNMSKEATALNSFTWIELTGLVHEQISSTVNNLHRLEEKVRHLEVVIQNKEKMLAEVQTCHQGQLERLAATLHDHQLTFQQQKQQLDQHYNDMLAELHTQSKKQQAMADQAWEKVRVTGSVQQSLQAECNQLQQQLNSYKREQAALLTACALLTGALYPLYLKTNNLATQKYFSQEHFQSHGDICKQIKVLTEAVSCTVVSQQSIRSTPCFSPLLTFRVGVIAVIAANRLCHLSQCSYKLFSLSPHQLGTAGSVVWTGRKPRAEIPFRGLSHPGQCVQNAEYNVSWLKSSQLLKVVKKSMSNLQDLIYPKKDTGHIDNKTLITAAKTAYLTFMEKVGPHFDGQPVDEVHEHRGKTSLTWQLSLGLKRVLSSMNVEDRLQYASVQHLLNQLQKHLMTMTQHLHTAEVERRNLRQELGHFKEDQVALQSTTHKLRHLEEQLQTQKLQSKGQVPSATFESVCHELDSALRREEQAQHLLREQSQQLQQLNEKLQVHLSEGSDKNNTLTKAVQELSETKMELRRKDQSLHQVSRSVSALQAEKQSLQQHLRDAENTLRTAAKDKDVHTTYIRSLIASIQTYKNHLQLNCDLQDIDLTSLLRTDTLPGDLSKMGSEVITSRSLVEEFVDLYRLVSVNTSALHQQMASHRQHIETLKRELNAACKREYADEEFDENDFQLPEKTAQSTSFGSPYKYKPKAEPKDVFMPLMEDTDLSYSVIQPSPKIKISHSSA